MPVSTARHLLQATVGICVCLAIAACNSSTPPAETRSGARESSALPVEATIVQARDLSRTVTLSAPIAALRQIELAAQTAGVITALEVEEGDRVEQGQVLASIDVRETQAELTRARALLAEQRVNLDRMKQLRASNFIDAASLSIAQTEMEVARAEVGLWETRVSFGTVKAPINGVVTARYVEPGEAIGQYAPLLSLADFDHLVVRFGLSELDVADLSVGDPVEVQIDALATAAPLAAQVRRIMPTTEDNSRLVVIEVLLPSGEGAPLRIGYLARTTLVVDRRPDVLAIPISSIGIRNGISHVMVITDDERLQHRPIRAGVARGEWREVLEGLTAGERVLRSNPANFADGDRVRVVPGAAQP